MGTDFGGQNNLPLALMIWPRLKKGLHILGDLSASNIGERGQESARTAAFRYVGVLSNNLILRRQWFLFD